MILPIPPLINTNNKFKVLWAGGRRRGAPSARNEKAKEFFVWLPGNP
jgi:hypothetical protein